MRLVDIAYIRDGTLLHTGESLALAVLMHSTGEDRGSKHMRDVQRIMNDPNYY